MAKELIKIYGYGKRENDYITFGAETEELLHNYTAYEKFIKGCEICVRNDDRYRAYIAKVREGGFNQCVFLGNLPDDPRIHLEMHHGPIFNLFDICDIVTKAMLKRGTIPDLTTMDVGDLVLTEHELDNIMIVMLSKTAHKGGHSKGSRNIFVDIKATIGRMDRFIDRWEDGMEEEHYYYIQRYIEECKKAKGSTDNGLFQTAESLLKFG